MHRWRDFAIVVGLLAVCLAASAWTPESGTLDDTLQTVRALDERSQKQHEQLLEDTQALADAYNGLEQQNTRRAAEIAALKQEIAAVRAELRALKAR
jgi:peptidoglycan hydrolase CwlO-like protein